MTQTALEVRMFGDSGIDQYQQEVNTRVWLILLRSVIIFIYKNQSYRLGGRQPNRRNQIRLAR